MPTLPNTPRQRAITYITRHVARLMPDFHCSLDIGPRRKHRRFSRYIVSCSAMAKRPGVLGGIIDDWAIDVPNRALR